MSQIVVLIVMITFTFVFINLIYRIFGSEHDDDLVGLYSEVYRPQYHFSPPKHWMNDPNGLIFFKDRYHLCFQYYSEGLVIPPHAEMVWGHATSHDLFHWVYDGVVIKGTDDYRIFSGSSILGPNEEIYAMWTADYNRTKENQWLSTSSDGFKFTDYPVNPIIDLDPKNRNFRDPKIIYYEELGYYVVAIALAEDKEIVFYNSTDLIHWYELSRFTDPPLKHVDWEWECPNLLKLENDEDEDDLFILIISVSPRRMIRYWIGHFDGMDFTASQDWELLDYGPDLYATQEFAGVDGRMVVLSWMLSWEYAAKSPTFPWRGVQNVPREMEVVKNEKNNRWTLLQKPVTEFDTLRQKTIEFTMTILLPGQVNRFRLPFLSNQVEIVVEEIKVQGSFEFWLHQFEGSQKTIFGYDLTRSEFYIQRNESGDISFSESFGDVSSYVINMDADKNIRNLRILIDWSSIEIFVNDGSKTMTLVVFPIKNSNYFSVSSSSGISFGKIMVHHIKTTMGVI